MRKFVKIAFVATNAVVIIAGAANAREDYSNIERQVTAREFRAQDYDTQQPSRRSASEQTRAWAGLRRGWRPVK